MNLAAQLAGLLERGVELHHGAARGHHQFAHQTVALGIIGGGAAFFDLAQAVVQRIDQQLAAVGVVQQVVLQIGVTLHHPDVAQHFVQHTGGSTGATLFAQLVQ